MKHQISDFTSRCEIEIGDIVAPVSEAGLYLSPTQAGLYEKSKDHKNNVTFIGNGVIIDRIRKEHNYGEIHIEKYGYDLTIISYDFLIQCDNGIGWAGQTAVKLVDKLA